MKFLISYKMKPENREAAIKRFRKTGGAAPAGVTLLGRWHSVGSNTGWSLVESATTKAIADFVFMWSDLMDLDVHPVIEDRELSSVFDTAGY